jgi:hypothetical protein
MRSGAGHGGREKLPRGHRDGSYIGLEVSNSWGGWSLSRSEVELDWESSFLCGKVIGCWGGVQIGHGTRSGGKV